MKVLVPFDFDTQYGYFLKDSYVCALQRQNVELVPQIYDLNTMKKNVLEVDGVLLPGGLGDIDPRLYGESAVHEKTKINSKRCDFELELIHSALKRDLPILGICFGFQILNVFFKGKLYQHIPDELPSSVVHEQKCISTTPCHRVSLTGFAADLCGDESTEVNSTHHQGVKSLGDGLECLGTSEDGLIEVIRHPKHHFVFGVEWHPERLEHDWVIPNFVKAFRR